MRIRLPSTWRASGAVILAHVYDTLIAALSAYGVASPQSLARVLRARERRVQRQLVALWLEDLVEVDGNLWRLSAAGHARARVLKENEQRFASLIRTR